MSLADAIDNSRGHGRRPFDPNRHAGGLILPVEYRTRTEPVLIENAGGAVTATVDGLELDYLAGVELVYDVDRFQPFMSDPPVASPRRGLYVGLWIAANLDGIVRLTKGSR